VEFGPIFSRISPAEAAIELPRGRKMRLNLKEIAFGKQGFLARIFHPLLLRHRHEGKKKTGSEEPAFSSLLDKSAFMMKWAPFSFNQETTPRRLNQVCCYAQLLITKNVFFTLDQCRSARR
jgi:hypothetical protein